MTMWPTGEAIPNTIFRLAGNGVVIRRTYNHSRSGREFFYRGVAMDLNTIRWFRVGSSPDSYSDWTFHESSGQDGIEGSYTIVPREISETQRRLTFHFGSRALATDQLAAAIAKAQTQDVGIVARANAQWQAYLANNSGVTTTNGWASALYSGLSAGVEAARVEEARSRQALDSTFAGINAQARAEAAAQAARERAGQQRMAQNVANAAVGQRAGQPATESRAQEHSAPAQAVDSAARRPAPPATPGTSTPESARQCRTVARTFVKKSIPLSTRILAENHVRGGLAGVCPLASTPSVGALSCTEDSQSVWGKDSRGVPVVTGRRTMFTCSATVSCSAVQVCDGSEESGASAQ